MKEHQSQRLYGNGGSRMLPYQVARLLPSLFSKDLKTWTYVCAALLLPKSVCVQIRFESLSKGIATEHRDERARLGTVHPRHRRGELAEAGFQYQSLRIEISNKHQR